MDDWLDSTSTDKTGADRSPVAALDPARTALLVIDVQHGLFQRAQPIYEAEQLLTNIHSLVERFHQAGSTVVYIQHENAKALQRDTPAWELHPALHPESHDLRVYKQHGNAFKKTPLGEMLNERGIITLVVTGLVTQGCVRATCEGAFILGYRVILVEDGHSNYHKDAAEVITEWNGKLSASWVELSPSSGIGFRSGQT